MLQYTVKRLPQLLLTLILASMFTFAMLRLVPGDIADVLAVQGAVSEADKAQIRQEQGLDAPLAIQYVQWVSRLVRGDFGHSYWTHLPVEALFAHAVPKTLELAVLAMAIGLVVGLPLGTLAGAFRGSLFDHAATFLAMSMIAMPTFALGLLALLVFSVRLQWLPATGSVVLASLVLGTDIAGTLVRTLRSDVRAELLADYVRTAHAKGLSPLTVLRRHVLPNSLGPTVTVMGLAAGHLLGGAVLIETIFNWPGLGSLMIDAIRNRDYPVVEAVVMVMTAAFVVVNFAVDLLYGMTDPRVRTP